MTRTSRVVFGGIRNNGHSRSNMLYSGFSNFVCMKILSRNGFTEWLFHTMSAGEWTRLREVPSCPSWTYEWRMIPPLTVSLDPHNYLKKSLENRYPSFTDNEAKIKIRPHSYSFFEESLDRGVSELLRILEDGCMSVELWPLVLPALPNRRISPLPGCGPAPLRVEQHKI